jgi:hypothetical protein
VFPAIVKYQFIVSLNLAIAEAIYLGTRRPDVQFPMLVVVLVPVILGQSYGPNNTVAKPSLNFFKNNTITMASLSV